MTDEARKIREELLAQLKRESGSADALDESASLLTWGINSITVMRILSQWAKRGYRVPFSELIRKPYIDSWAELFANASADKDKKINKQQKNESSMYEPFELTDMQYAYWVGRDSSQQLGGVGCHGYFEVNCQNLDLERLEQAWQMLFECHPMLRACFSEDGMQRVLREPYQKKIVLLDLSILSEIKRQNELNRIREEHSHRLLQIEKGEVISLLVTKHDENSYRMHFEIDLLVCDVQSFGIILQDLAVYYLKKEYPQVEKEWDFSEYLKNKKEQKKNEYEQAKAYWVDRVKSLPYGPKLPVQKKKATSEQLKFHRHAAEISPEETRILMKKGSEQGVTLAVVLLTAYGKTVSKWANEKRFLMNMPMFNRDEEEGIAKVVADFTNLLLVDMDFSRNLNFGEYLKLVQQSFLESIDHAACSGVEILREFRKQHGENAEATTVFSCNLGTSLISEDFRKAFGTIDYMISQTPQVLIDFQAFTQDEGLLFIWDAADDMFPEGMIDEMFSCFLELIHLLGKPETEWDQTGDILSESQNYHKNRAEAFLPENMTVRTMVEDIFRKAEINPDRTALIEANGERVSYGNLAKQAKAIAGALQKHGIQKGDYVAVVLPRGVKCVIAQIAVITAGAAYVPISIEQPQIRRDTIIKTAGCKAVIYTKDSSLNDKILEKGWLTYEDCISAHHTFEPVAIDSDDTAYVIFTSGSTGNPKGVEIAHGAAMNTIDTVNERYSVNENDCAIAVSSNDFDLSVYDIFGLLSRGGRLVLIGNEGKRDASLWLKLIRQYRVTIWNSVPTLMKMLLAESENENVFIPSLRLVILSGDWIGLDMPDKIKNRASGAHLAAMGGATEAAIWSNVYDVKLPIPKEWESIPYGEPLANQFYRVIGDDGKDCPNEVGGELWIGGLGVAKGYIGDPVLTAEKFVKEFGKRWYRTGDNGRFWKNDIIEFLGRRDNQVKLRGHRIELGEVESALCTISGVTQAVAAVHEVGNNRQLNAFVTGENVQNIESDEKSDGAKKTTESIQLNKKYDASEESETNKIMAAVTKRTITAIISQLSNIDAEKISDDYQALYKEWTQWLSEIDVPEENDLGKTAFGDLLDRFTKPFIKKVPDILLGRCNPNELLLENGFVSPNTLASEMPRGRFLQACIDDLIYREREQKNHLRILEIGARNIKRTKNLIETIPNSSYTLLDKSLFFIRTAKSQLGGNAVTYIKANLDEGFPDEIEYAEYDVIFLNYTLHQFENIDHILDILKVHLAVDGMLIFYEMVKEMPLQDVTSVFLMNDTYTDFRSRTGNALLSSTEWQDLLEQHHFNIVDVLQESREFSEQMSQQLYVIRNESESKNIRNFNEDEIRSVLGEKLPEYMVPVKIKWLDHFPLTSNGKVDRRRILKENSEWMEEEIAAELEEPSGETEIRLANVWKEVLGCDVSRNDSYFRLGGDSLLATVLVGKIKEEFGIAFPMENIFQYPILKEMAVSIEKWNGELSGEEEADMTLELFEDKAHAYDPFPLTDVQQAYWIGRTEEFNYSKVSTHCYFEMDCENLDFSRAEEVWNSLIRTHAMLRAVILKDGERQQILRETDYYKLCIYDCSAKEDEYMLDRVREEMSQEIIDIYQWPLFDIRAAKLEGDKSRLFISFDNIILDGWSMFYLFREWEYYCAHPEEKPEEEDISFRDYVLSCEALKNNDRYQQDHAYWEEKLPTIHPAPEFSMFGGDAKKANRFVRFSHRLTARQWKRLEDQLKERSITPAVFLMGSYAETIGLWCEKPRFSINLTRFNRLKFGDAIDHTVGDYTSLTIHSIDLSMSNTFDGRLKNMQENLWADLNHPLVSGIEVERMLNQAYGTGSMPVVFTCGLGLEKGENKKLGKYPGRISYGNSQTPQVWLDYQVYEEEGELIISWDALIDIFPEKMVDEMFKAYIELLENLSERPEIWTKQTKSLVQIQADEKKQTLNSTAIEFPEETLISLIKKSVERHADRPAVISSMRQLNYKELYEQAEKLAATLLQAGMKKGDIIAIYKKKGLEQIVALTAVLLAGGAYLPLNTEAPIQRNQNIIDKSGAAIVLTDVENIEEESSSQKENNIFKNVQILDVESALNSELSSGDLEHHMTKPSDLAYIIYTSGTTGEPKGVAIEHRGVVNTILDINQRLNINENDRSIAISDLSFDLSVYDIFGMLSAGGAIIIPDESLVKEPSEWKRLIEENDVTIWNTVPMFMQMLLEYLQYHPFEKASSLRYILMSGDWIPISIREEIEQYIGECKVYGLGGATEASIWSNIYLIEEIDPKWRSIPYGKPLSNQRYYVLNEQMMDCPYDVIGDLYIGGEGLAREYWHNPEETEKSFTTHPETGERLYRTGDKALYMRDGNIEFCGRRDGQVKLGGFRVELGEVNHVLCEHEKVKQAESIVVDGEILTFIVSNVSENNDDFMLELKRTLEEKVPHYMIPAEIQSLKKMPLTANGKVDRKALLSLVSKEERCDSKSEDRTEWTQMEKEVGALWEEVLHIDHFGRDEAFVRIGGNSLAAVQLVNQMTQKYQVDLMIQDFYRNATVRKLAAYLEDAIAEEETGLL